MGVRFFLGALNSQIAKRSNIVIFFTSDLHLGHENIIRFCGRPFRDMKHMNERLIANWNERVRYRDTVYHVGDFAFKTGLQGGRLDPFEYEDKLNGTIVHILGNHDRNNHLRNSITKAHMRFGKSDWILQHRPPLEEQLLADSEHYGHVNYIVGHVHEKWKFRLYNDIVVVNVGVDVNNYYPIKLQELIVQVARFKKENNV